MRQSRALLALLSFAVSGIKLAKEHRTHRVPWCGRLSHSPSNRTSAQATTTRWLGDVL